MNVRPPKSAGFTLIELSIVLVVVGLIVGAVLVGQDLISAARVRATIAHIEKYKTAYNTFRVRYNLLPGDLTSAQATQFGFLSRTGDTCDGDGDEYIYGVLSAHLATEGMTQAALGGETVFFWTDLAAAQLIEGGFHDSTDTYINVTQPYAWQPYLPQAKIGDNGFISAFSNRPDSYGMQGQGYRGLVFELFQPYSTNSPTDGEMNIYGGTLTQLQAYSMDTKMDDGLPASGTVQAASGFAVGVTGTFIGGPGTSATNCISPLPYMYNIQYSAPSCNLMFRGE